MNMKLLFITSVLFHKDSRNIYLHMQFSWLLWR